MRAGGLLTTVMSNMHICPAPAGGDAVVSWRLSWDTSASFGADLTRLGGGETHYSIFLDAKKTHKSSRIYKKMFD